MFFTIARHALALAVVLITITNLLACGGGDDEACPAQAEPRPGMQTIPAQPCRADSQ